MSWASPEIRRAGWDTETSGLSVTEDRIVTAAVLFTGGDRPEQLFTWVINPGIDVPTAASNIHGWTTERLRAEGADPKTALDDIAEKLTAALTWGMPLIGFNAVFDFSILHHDLLRHGLPTVMDRVGYEPHGLVCGLILDKAVDRYRAGSRKLADVAAHYGVELTGAHTADGDTRAAVGVAEQIAARHPRVGEMGPAGLFAFQREQAAAQAASLQEYKRRTDATFTADGSWPLRAVSS
jgi:DNA polymerase-3 subunit epsilon